MNTYNVAEFARIVGVAVNTLQRWDREGRLKPGRTPGNRRVYTDEHVAQVIGQQRSTVERVNVVYARVSSPSQKDDLGQQVKALEVFCAASGIAVDDWVKEIGGGLSFKRKKFRELVQRIEANRVGTVVVAHKDRLSRFGFDLIDYLCELHGTKLVVMNQESLRGCLKRVTAWR